MRYFQVYSRFQPPQTFIRPPRDSERSKVYAAEREAFDPQRFQERCIPMGEALAIAGKELKGKADG